MTVRFDDSLPVAQRIIQDEFGNEVAAKAVFVRDTTGRLSVVLDADVTDVDIESAESRLREALEGYGRQDRILADRNGFGAKRILEEGVSARSHIANGHQVRYIERRIIGADWLIAPNVNIGKVPRIVFSSLKGGVGRSTALCVMASHLSRRGLRVLCLDFDLEAPGIGSMLLRQEELPDFGTLDYFVESGISAIDAGFITNLVGDSYLGGKGARVGVIPAVGARTVLHPQNAISKISRAYLEEVRDDGRTLTLTDRLRELLELLESTSEFDVILIDARAGLHESTAAAIQGVGGETLLFGTDQPQTFLGYSLLMRHLAQFAVDAGDDWRDRLRFVHAKASDGEKKQSEANERFADLYRMLQINEQVLPADSEPITADDFTFVWNEEQSTLSDIEDAFTPPTVLRILDDSNYRDFDPISRESLLEHATYFATFGPLLEYSDEIAEEVLSSKSR